MGEKALAVLGRWLHQDADLSADNVDELAEHSLDCLTPGERAALRAYLADALTKFTPAELKGQLNRSTSHLRFDSRGADRFLRALFVRLDSDVR